MTDQTAEQIVIIDSPQLRVHIEPVLSLAVLAFKGYATSEQYKKNIYALLNLVKKEDIPYFLVNCSKDCTIKDENLDWTLDTVTQELARGSDLKKITIVEPPNVYSRVNLFTLFEKLSHKSNIEIQFFEKEKNARSWIYENSNLDF